MPIKLKLQQYLMLLLSTPLLIAITPKLSPAFTIKQTTKINNNFSDYSFFYDKAGKLEGIGITTLGASDPLTPWSQNNFSPFLSKIKLGGTAGLLEDLELYMNEGWTFSKGHDLKGSFDVKRYYACGISKICGSIRVGGINTGGVGAALELNYRPDQKASNKRKVDPKPQNSYLYWIQRVITNYPSTTNKVGQRTTYIDNLNAIHPYYGRYGDQIENNGYFGDRPYRGIKTELKEDFYWIAELYLAEADKINQQKVTIYNGVRWGWKYDYFSKDELKKSCPITNNNNGNLINVSNSEKNVWDSLQDLSLINGICDQPPPKPPKPPKPPCSGGSGGGGCRSRRSQPATTDYVEILDQIESQELSESGDRHDTSTPTKQKNPRTHFSFCFTNAGSRSDRYTKKP